MRFIEKVKTKIAESRTVLKFLWLPLKIGNETRWLEKATIYQEYTGDEWVSMGFKN